MDATITYLLDGDGQRASLAAGGDGKQKQIVSVEVHEEDMGLLTVSTDGKLSAEAVESGEPNPYGGWKTYYFPHVPSAEELFGFMRERARRRKAVEEARAEEYRKKVEEEKREAEKRRAAAAGKLREMLAAGQLAATPREGYVRIYPGSGWSADLHVDDPECGGEVREMLARIAAEKQRVARYEARRKKIQDIRRAARFPVRLVRKGSADRDTEDLCAVVIPEVAGSERGWAKRVDLIDPKAKDGYSFEGPWLRPGEEETLESGQMVLCGSKQWSGSRKRGEWVYRKELYLVTPMGLFALAEDGHCKTVAIEYMALEPGERVSRCLRRARGEGVNRLAALRTLDSEEFREDIDLTAEIAARLTEEIKFLAEIDETLSGRFRDALAESAVEAAIEECWQALEKLPEKDRGKVLAELHQRLEGTEAQSMESPKESTNA